MNKAKDEIGDRRARYNDNLDHEAPSHAHLNVSDSPTSHAIGGAIGSSDRKVVQLFGRRLEPCVAEAVQLVPAAGRFGAKSGNGSTWGASSSVSAVGTVLALRNREGLAKVVADLLQRPDPTKLRRQFLEWAIGYSGKLPFGGRSYHPGAVLDLAGVPREAWYTEPALRDDADAVAAFFQLDDVRYVPERGAGHHVTKIGLGRAVIADMVVGGEKIETEQMGRMSLDFLADRIGMCRSDFRRNTGLMKLFRSALKDGTLVLGRRFVDALHVSRKEKREARKVLRTALARRVELGDALDASVQRCDRYDFDRLFDEAGIVDVRVREVMKTDPPFRVDLFRTKLGLGIKPVHFGRINAGRVTYGRLLAEGTETIARKYRAGRPEIDAGKDDDAQAKREKAYMDNQRSALMRQMRVLSRDLEHDAALDFATEGLEDRRRHGHGDSKAGNAEYDRCLARWGDAVDSLRVETSYPTTFAGALDAGMIAKGINAPKLAKLLEIKTALLHAWRRGGSLPTFQNAHVVSQVETALDMPPGTLHRRMPSVLASRTHSSRRDVTLSDGRKVNLGSYWRFLDKMAPTWDEERLRAAVEQADLRQFGRDTRHRVRQRATFTNAYGLPQLDAGWPIVREIEDYVSFLSNFATDHRVLHPRAGLRTAGSRKSRRSQLVNFGRWLALPSDLGGLGLTVRQVSLRVVLNPRVVQKYIAWRILRSANLELRGTAIGPIVAATEKMLLAMFGGMLDPSFGWLAQSPDVLGVPEPIDKTFVLPILRSTRTGIEVMPEEAWLTLEVVPVALAEAAAADWRAASSEAHRQVFAMQGRIAATFQMVRSPADLLGPLLKHPAPLTAALRMVGDALKHVRPIERSPYMHAIDVQRALAFLMLLIVVFRSATLRELTWMADGSGQLRKVHGSWDLVVPADCFKNVASTELFGPSWNRRDYERDLGDWGDLGGLLDHFIEKCRPILLNGRELDTLFVPPRIDKWDEHSFNYLIMCFTRRWVVYNARYGTGMKGVTAFGPHPVRNIVATHILRTVKTEDRWRLASLILGTGIERIKRNYAWIDTRSELAKLDSTYDEASRRALSDVDLW